MAAKFRGDNRASNMGMWLVVTISIFALAYVQPAIGQDQAVQSPAASEDAVSTKVFGFDIPAKPLPQAITDLSGETGLQVLYTEALPFQRQASAVKGKYTAVQALDLMLAGSGLTYRFTSANAVTLEKLPPGATSGSISLPAVQVQGRGSPETAYTPITGYVAKTSIGATKTDTSILETPQSINIVTRDQMNDQASQNVMQALRYTPGVTTELAGADNRMEPSNIVIRGFTAQEYWNGLTLEGGDYLYPQIDPYMLERIEVMKGPDSVLYGQATPGGLIDLVSKRPLDTPYHELVLQGGSYGTSTGAFDFSGPLDKDGTVLYRLTGIGSNAGTQVDHTGYQRLAIAPSLTWRPNEDTSLTFLTSYQYDPEAGFFNAVPQVGSLQHNPNGSISTSRYLGEPDYDQLSRTQYSVGYEFDHQFDDIWSVHQNFRYMNTAVDYQTVYASDLESDLRTEDRGLFSADDHLRTIALDNRAQAKFDLGPVNQTFVFGLDFQNSLLSMRDGYGDAPPIDIYTPNYGAPLTDPVIDYKVDQTTNQIGLYAQDQIKFYHFSLLLGVRHDWASGDTKDHIEDTTTKLDNEKTTWRAGLVYLFDSGIAPYVSYSTSFQPTTGTSFDGSVFKPTTGQQYEAGVKYQPKGYNSFITASVFNLTEQNVLTTDPDPSHPFSSVQAGEIRSRGVELEGKASLTDNIDLLASYTYLDNINTKGNGGIQGHHPVAIPNQSASLWGKYTFGGEGPVSGLSFGGGTRFIGHSWATTDNSLKVPAVWLFDASTQYDLGKVSSKLQGLNLQVNATNLLDKKYIASCSYDSCEYGLRRSVLATLRYSW